ncbi:MAG: alpha-amylase family glycosyl hydrolase [Brevinema sp.]
MGLQIYNLFPRYYDNCHRWSDVFPHIVKLGFDAVYINPFHYAGFSGSLYAPKDYFSLNPICIDESAAEPPMDQLKAVVELAHQSGLKVVMDLVINHTSKDHPFVNEHPSWYILDAQGNLQSPGAWENGLWVEWGDLAQIDNAASQDKEELWAYWEKLLLYYIDLGFDAFRADAAYQIPSELWVRLITVAKERNPNTLFLAESLGCTPAQSIGLADVGFDYLFNSAKWWDFTEAWFIDQYNEITVPTISFPESHDTQRAAQEITSISGLKRLISFTGLISPSWMIVSGTEWGWKNKTDVVNTKPSDKENINIDLTGFITSINTLRKNNSALQERGLLIPRDHDHRSEILALEKQTDKGSFLFLINKTDRDNSFVTINLEDFLNSSKIQLLFSSEDAMKFSSSEIPLKPWELKLFYFIKR